MTIEEMRAEIEKYCNYRVSIFSDCVNCPLGNTEEEGCYSKNSIGDEGVKRNYNILVNCGAIKKKESDVHLNGYIFDSLMYCYQVARERQLFLEVIQEHKDVEKAREQCNRDVLKFREILKEAMGEHD